MRDNEPPSEGRGRYYAKKAVETIVAGVPVVGGPIAVIWAEYAGAAFEKRRQAWEARITQDVVDLISRVDRLSPEAMVESPAFLDAVAFATRTATTTLARKRSSRH